MGSDWLERSFGDKNLEVLMDNKLNMNQECALAAKEGQQHFAVAFCCSGKRVASRTREVILALYAAIVRSHLECCARFWSL